MTLPPPLVEFLALCREARFWDAHEVLEDPWRETGSAFYQGLILYASAWVHWQRGNAHGVGAQLAKAHRRLAPLPSPYLGLDVEAIREHCISAAGVVEFHPGDWTQRVAPLVLDADPARIRGDEAELGAGLTLVARARAHAARPALVTPEGEFTYADLLAASAAVAARLLDGRPTLAGARICFLVPPGWDYVRTLWGIWRAGGLAVPLAVSHPPAELAYVLDDADPEAVVAHPSLAARVAAAAAQRGIPLLSTASLEGAEATLPEVESGHPALMLYTSGTTGRPKGVVTTHANIRAQVEALVQAWGWTGDDRILLHLPLHHVHGIVNVLTCALWSGAVCEILPAFDAREVWERLAHRHLTLYMAVPTVYRRLIEAWEAADPATRERWSRGAAACRLMVSGSAALPVPTLERWEALTGHRLLERYGMTEIGMGLSNPLRGERRPGHVGRPLPGVELRLVDDEGTPVADGEAGEIQVRGPAVFGEYWRRPDATAEAFTDDGWFRTGDRAVADDGAYRILGRMSVDILKTGGEKVSALEIEDVLRSHPEVRDCAVVGVPDPAWGDRVCAAVVPRSPASPPDPEALRAFLRERLAPYKVPKEVLLLDDLPRNAMGKVTKPAVKNLFET